MIDDDEDAYPLGEYPPLECFTDMIAAWFWPWLLNRFVDCYLGR